jgi:hypothetical protein
MLDYAALPPRHYESRPGLRKSFFMRLVFSESLKAVAEKHRATGLPKDWQASSKVWQKIGERNYLAIFLASQKETVHLIADATRCPDQRYGEFECRITDPSILDAYVKLQERSRRLERAARFRGPPTKTKEAYEAWLDDMGKSPPHLANPDAAKAA